MRRHTITLLLAFSFCLPGLLIELIPNWTSHSTAASQDKPAAAEVTAAIEEQKQEAANMARSELAERKFQELSAKASLDGTAPVIVKLRVAFRPEGDLPSAAGVQAQRAVIAQSQDSLMQEMTGYDPASLKRFEFTPYVAMRVSAAGLEELRLSSNVIDIHQDDLLAPSLAESAPLSRAPFAWADGHTGAGKTVAILDSGVDKTHPFLAGKVVSEACYSTTNAEGHATSLCPGGVAESTDDDSGRNCTGPSGCFHGTHVAGIAAGKGANFSGIAKDANLIAIQVFSKIDDSTACNGSESCIRSFTSDLLKGLERVYSLRNTHSIASVNMSLGSGRFTSNCDTNPLKGIIDQLRSAGIATVIASGNDGHTDGISQPACISSAISVGATGDGTRVGADNVASFSNSASFLNLLAPGDSIVSSVPGGGFGTASGTSMATPHVAGAWAILKQRNPGASVTELLNLLTSRGFPVTDTRNGLNFPRLNLGPPPSCITAAVPSNRWRGEYYGNTDLSGGALMIRDDGAGPLNFDIGGASPSVTCGLGADNFSVRWTQSANFTVGLYRFTVTGDDGVRLYIDGQLKIDKWFPQGATTYTTDVFLTTGVHEIKLEYFEGGGGALARVSWATLVGGACYTDVPQDQWKGEYFSNTNLADNPRMIRNDGAGFLNFDFGLGGPNSACGLGVDNFSARWTRRVNFTIGVYRFTVTGDDGVRLYIDGQLKIDKWFLQGATAYTTDVFLTTGSHEIKLEYFESGGGALARLSWAALGAQGCYADVPSTQWRGEYYSNTNLADNPAMVRNDGAGFLNFEFGLGGPSAACGLGVDNFSARWTRTVNFSTGIHRFSVTGDDGVRLFINGELVIDKWFLQGATTYTADVFISGGTRQIRLEYFENGGGALARLTWELLANSCFANVPSDQWKGEYFSNTELMGNPAMVRNDGAGFLNFDFGLGGPNSACGLGADNFSARWTRRVNFSTGTYRFSVSGDDGVRLFINGVSIINKWFPQGVTTYTADVALSSGDYDIRLEYFEGGGGALARLNWALVSGP